MKNVLRLALLLTIIAAGAAIYAGLQIKKQKQELTDKFEKETAKTTTLTKQLGDEKKSHDSTKSTLASTKKSLEAATSEVEEKKKEVAAKEAAIKEAREKSDAISQELAEKKTEMDKVLKALPPGMTLDQIQPKLKEFQDNLTTLEQEKKILNEQLAKMDVEKKKLEDQLQRRKTGTLLPGTFGHVIAVNEDWNFVVLDVGANQGIVESAPMVVYRDGKLVGKVKITSVEPSIAIADVLPEWKQENIQEGDMVSD